MILQVLGGTDVRCTAEDKKLLIAPGGYLKLSVFSMQYVTNATKLKQFPYKVMANCMKNNLRLSVWFMGALCRILKLYTI